MRKLLIFWTLLVAACGTAVVESGDVEGSDESAVYSGPIVDLNAATLPELEALPAVSVRRAAAIVADRDANGWFYEAHDVVRVWGVGEGTWRRIRDFVKVGEACGGFAGLPCPEGQACQLHPVDANVADAMGVCIDDPAWNDPCAAVRCIFGYHCELGQCILDDLCTQVVGNHVEPLCAEGERCVLTEVWCIRAPCPPVASCEPDEPVDQGCYCTMQYDPVCGVDGHTYGNACAAGCANVEVAFRGACE